MERERERERELFFSPLSFFPSADGLQRPCKSPITSKIAHHQFL
jgi:hypothetical protein